MPCNARRAFFRICHSWQIRNGILFFVAAEQAAVDADDA